MAAAGPPAVAPARDAIAQPLSEGATGDVFDDQAEQHSLVLTCSNA